MVLIVLIGLARFAAGVMSVPYEHATRLLSITITTMVLAVVYGARAAATGFGGYRHLLPMVVMLALAMYGFSRERWISRGRSAVTRTYVVPVLR